MLNLRNLIKESAEIFYWKIRRFREKKLTNFHYEYFYKDYFGLSKDFYQGKENS